MIAPTKLQVLRVTREFETSPDALFDAWTNPDMVGRWLFTTPGSESHSVEADVRPGGKWTITDIREGVEYKAVGEYLDVDRPGRLVFTFGMPQFSPALHKVTVEINATDKGAQLTLIQEGLPPEAIRPLEQGWREMFDMLAVILHG
ncbi:MAG TPA: SRPBCC family protein [Caulobacteraceae bacterium]|jgi:uncharacterized protein YndB with AHSA1/START domain